MRPPYLVTVVLAVVGPLLGYWGWTKIHHRSSTIVETPLADADPSGVENDVAALQAALATTQERLARLEAKSSVPPNRQGDPKTAQSPQQLPTSQENQQDVEKAFELRLKASAAEPRDEVWARSQEEKISGVLGQAMPTGEKYDVDKLACKTSICVLEVSSPSPMFQHRLAFAFSNLLTGKEIIGTQLRPMVEREDGSVFTQVLFFRSGYGMPGMTE